MSLVRYAAPSITPVGRSNKRTRKSARAPRRGQVTLRVPRVPFFGWGFPDVMRMKMRYADVTYVTLAAGAFRQQIFACNGLYKPDITASGHQPHYFDQVMALYNHYHVISSKISVQISPPYANSQIVAAICQDDDSSLSTNSVSAMSEMYPSASVIANTWNGLPAPMMLYSKWSAAKSFGVPVMTRNDLKGTVSANPFELTYYHIGVEDPYGSLSQAVYMKVVIEYNCEFSEVKSVAQS